MPHHEDKAGRYLALLDTARVSASWSELPELIRKVNKHAPQQQTLIQTATAEYQVATDTTRSSSSSSTDFSALTSLAGHLRSQNRPEEEDVFQGRTCLLWARWNGMMSRDDLQAAGTDRETIQPNLMGKSLSTWTKVCLVKSAYIQGTSCCRNGAVAEARSIFMSAVDSMQSDRELVLSTPQLAYWSEQLLAQLTMNASSNGESTSAGSSARLEAFRYWYVLATKTREGSASTYRNASAHLSRSSVWKEYYKCVSASLREGHGRDTLISHEARMQQSTELRKVERAYENEILRSRKFPEATGSNESVERWVESVVHNWHVLCGSDWHDAELGEGGRDAVARNVLDVLYRAATKTFHSTLILRRLFQVHKSLTEFDLAYKAFDTYVDLIERGRARVAKGSKSEPAQESLEIVLATVSEAIEGLCSFGRQAEARKAYDLCTKLEDWLEEVESNASTSNEVNGTQQNGYTTITTEEPPLPPTALERIYRSIGVAKAQWTRWTPFSENRASLQEDALVNLRKACLQRSPQDIQIETYFATGLLLAETREITQAIDLVKQALTKGTSNDSESTQWATERKSIPLWHLLALLLSARGDHDSATKSCVAAFEQFPSTTVLLGSNNHSTNNTASAEKVRATGPGLVDDMECDELQRMIEIRITELALTELGEGPEEAVNCSNELLSLFSQLFAHLQISLDPSATSRSLQPPQSSAGTVKTMGGSMFSRRKHTSSIGPIAEKQLDDSSMITSTTRPSTRATQAPTIQITDEQGKSPSHNHQPQTSTDQPSHGHLSSLEGSVRRLAHRHSQRSNRHKNDHIPVSEPASVSDQHNTMRVSYDRASANMSGDTRGPETSMPPVQEQPSVSRNLPLMEHNLNSHEEMPPPLSPRQQPPQQDVRLPNLERYTTSTSPIPRFTKSATQKHAIIILTKIWLVIATLYRRASMFEDSKEACEEATKAASKIEEIVGAVDQSARAFADPGWGGGKSVDEIWADVYCERAELHLAIHQRRVQEGQELHYEEVRNAVEQYEQCLMYFPNHTGGIIGLSNVLLDYYEKKVDLSKKIDDGRPQGIDTDKPLPVRPGLSRDMSTLSNGSAVPPRSNHTAGSAEKIDEDLRKTPENLNRIAARDRAYGLLSTLTKLGSGWDNSEAWFALARAHELGGEIERAKSILWWCVELEDSKPIRHWRNLGYSI